MSALIEEIMDHKFDDDAETTEDKIEIALSKIDQGLLHLHQLKAAELAKLIPHIRHKRVTALLMVGGSEKQITNSLIELQKILKNQSVQHVSSIRNVGVEDRSTFLHSFVLEHPEITTLHVEPGFQVEARYAEILKNLHSLHTLSLRFYDVENLKLILNNLLNVETLILTIVGNGTEFIDFSWLETNFRITKLIVRLCAGRLLSNISSVSHCALHIINNKELFNFIAGFHLFDALKKSPNEIINLILSYLFSDFDFNSLGERENLIDYLDNRSNVITNHCDMLYRRDGFKLFPSFSIVLTENLGDYEVFFTDKTGQQMLDEDGTVISFKVSNFEFLVHFFKHERMIQIKSGKLLTQCKDYKKIQEIMTRAVPYFKAELKSIKERRQKFNVVRQEIIKMTGEELCNRPERTMEGMRERFNKHIYPSLAPKHQEKCLTFIYDRIKKEAEGKVPKYQALRKTIERKNYLYNVERPLREATRFTAALSVRQHGGPSFSRNKRPYYTEEELSKGNLEAERINKQGLLLEMRGKYLQAIECYEKVMNVSQNAFDNLSRLMSKVEYEQGLTEVMTDEDQESVQPALDSVSSSYSTSSSSSSSTTQSST